MDNRPLYGVLISAAVVVTAACITRFVVRNQDLTERSKHAPRKKEIVKPADYDNIHHFSDTETRVRFRNFTVVFHNFKGYQLDYDEDGSTYIYPDTLALVNSPEAMVYDEDTEEEGDAVSTYVETLIAGSDTFLLEETKESVKGEQYIDNTLLEVIPKFEGDSFSVSYCYRSGVSEAFNRTTPNSVQSGEKVVSFKEYTEYTMLKDSANYFFREFYTQPNVTTFGVSGENVVQVDPNRHPDRAQRLDNVLLQEQFRLSKKYNLIEDSERTYEFRVIAYLYKITRFHSGKEMETRYFHIYIKG